MCRYGRRPGQPSSSSLARRACVHFDFIFLDFLYHGSAPGPFGDRGDTPRWGLMAGDDSCVCSLLYAVYQMLSLWFPTQPESTELPATTKGRWRRRHLSPGHKARLLTVLLMCTGCAFQVAPGVEKGVTLSRATNPRTPRTGRTTRTPLQSLFLTSFMVSSCFSAHSCLRACPLAPFLSSGLRRFSLSYDLELRVQCVFAACTASSCHLEGRRESSMVCTLFSLTPLYRVLLLPRQFDESSNSHCSAQPTSSSSWTSPVSFSRLEEEPTIFHFVLAWREGFPEIPRESRGVKGLGRVIAVFYHFLWTH